MQVLAVHAVVVDGGIISHTGMFASSARFLSRCVLDESDTLGRLFID